MYYPEETVEEVLHAINIVDVVGSYVHLQKRGSNHFGLCPFHNEKTPSFSVSEPKQIFYCFGCGVGGNAVTFLMKYENYSFAEALQTLADRAGIKLPEVNYSEEAAKREEKRKLLLEINKETAIYYYRLLRSSAGRKGAAASAFSLSMGPPARVRSLHDQHTTVRGSSRCSRRRLPLQADPSALPHSFAKDMTLR